MRPSNESGTYDRKQDMGSDLAFSPGNGALDKIGEENMNPPLEAAS